MAVPSLFNQDQTRCRQTCTFASVCMSVYVCMHARNGIAAPHHLPTPALLVALHCDDCRASRRMRLARPTSRCVAGNTTHTRAVCVEQHLSPALRSQRCSVRVVMCVVRCVVMCWNVCCVLGAFSASRSGSSLMMLFSTARHFVHPVSEPSIILQWPDAWSVSHLYT